MARAGLPTCPATAPTSAIIRKSRIPGRGGLSGPGSRVRPTRNPITRASRNPTTGELGPISWDIETGMLSQCYGQCFKGDKAGNCPILRPNRREIANERLSIDVVRRDRCALLTGWPRWYLADVKWACAHFFVGVAKRES